MDPHADHLAWRTPRRAFVKTMALAGAALPWAAAPARADAKTSGPRPILKNRWFEAEFDPATGFLNLHRRGQPFLLQAVARAATTGDPRTTSDAGYVRTVEHRASHDSLGAGRQLVLRCADTRKQVDLEVRVILPDAREAVALEVLCRNVSGAPLALSALEPLRAHPREGARLQWPGVTKVLTNGIMYHDAGRVLDFPGSKDVKTWWNLCLYSGDRNEGLVAGFLENSVGLGRLYTRPDDAGGIKLVAEAQLAPGFLLAPGAAVTSERLLLLPGATPFAALEDYAQAVGDAHRIRLNPPVNGWCSWFSFFGAITEAEVLRQAAFAARELKPYGFEHVQVDDGFYRAFGDWEGNSRFPHGMKWLAREIRRLGLKPGIWLAPFVIAEGTEVFARHPEWLVRRPDGSLKQIGPGLVEGSPEAARQNPKLHALDITHPGAADWLRQLLRTAAHDWGYDFIKIDFVEWSLLAAEVYHDPAVSRAAAYRKGFEIMRQAVGPERHLLDCGPGPVSAGLLDSMRIELDQPPVTWQQYFLHPASTAPAAAKRYYFHKRVWINDADHVVLANLSVPQAQAAATIVGLSGGNMISGDRMSDLDPARLEILRKVFPSQGEAARPVDLFESDKPEVFVLPVKKTFGEWVVVGLFNADQQNGTEKRVALERLGLDPAKTYVAFDFWNQKYFGELRGDLRAPLLPASVTLLAIHEKRGAPQLIATDRHVSQGAVELESFRWEAGAGELSGVSLGAPGTSHHVYVYLPEARPWEQRDLFCFHDYPWGTAKITEAHILRLRVRFEAASRVPWKLNLQELLSR